MLQNSIENILKNIKYKPYETIEGKIEFDKNINLNITYKSFKPENKILVISSNKYNLDELSKNIVDFILLSELLEIRAKSQKNFKKILKKRIILMHSSDLGKIGLILSKLKKKPVYIGANPELQIEDLIYQKNLKCEKSYVIFKICKVKNITSEIIINKFKEIIESVNKINPELKVNKIAIRTTMGKYYESTK